MNISLSKQLEKWVRDRVKSGDFETASEVIRDALRIAKDRAQAIESLRRDLRPGMKSLDRGDVRPLDDDAMRRIVAAGRKKLASRAAGARRKAS
ncbi:MAG: type II toxin-antitoxin system ParD family antitoxin [Phycisphaerales bacterium]